MTTEGMAETDIQRLMNLVERREITLWAACAAVMILPAVLAIFWNPFRLLSDNGANRGTCCMLALFPVAFLGFLFGEWRISSRAIAEYLVRFPIDNDRKTADRVFARLHSQSIAISRIRRKLGIILKRFYCSVCGRRAPVEQAGQILQCKRCHTMLAVPDWCPPCPFCGMSDAIIVAPGKEEEYIEGATKGTVAGALRYGPAGLLLGGVLDGASNSVKGIFSSKRPERYRYWCRHCGGNWGTKLHPVPGGENPGEQKQKGEAERAERGEQKGGHSYL